MIAPTIGRNNYHIAGQNKIKYNKNMHASLTNNTIL